jgi:DNA sulfur modification protein DndB
MKSKTPKNKKQSKKISIDEGWEPINPHAAGVDIGSREHWSAVPPQAGKPSGQHRVEGIRIAHQQCPGVVKADEYPVILVAHIDDAEGKVQTRRLFSDINKRAVPVSNGDKVVIDEDELNAIVARRIYASYGHFKRGELIANTETEKLPDGDQKHFTNLLTLYAVNKRLRKLYHRARGVPEYDVKNVAGFYDVAATFYDFVIENVPSYHRFFSSKRQNLTAERRNNCNLLFRPAGLRVLAALYVHFVSQDQLPRLAKGLGIMKFHSPDSLRATISVNAGSRPFWSACWSASSIFS